MTAQMHEMYEFIGVGGWGVWLKSCELIEFVKSDSYLLISFVEQ